MAVFLIFFRSTLYPVSPLSIDSGAISLLCYYKSCFVNLLAVMPLSGGVLCGGGGGAGVSVGQIPASGAGGSKCRCTRQLQQQSPGSLPERTSMFHSAGRRACGGLFPLPRPEGEATFICSTFTTHPSGFQSRPGLGQGCALGTAWLSI